MNTGLSGVSAILIVCFSLSHVAADEQYPPSPPAPAPEKKAQSLGDARPLLLGDYVVASPREAEAKSLRNARTNLVAGIVLTSLGSIATIGLLVSGSLLETCIAARNRASGEGCNPSDLSFLSTITGITGGFALADLGLGIPLWAVGQSRLSKIKHRAHLTIVPQVESGGLAGASANLGFVF